jgi:hypothetical protein
LLLIGCTISSRRTQRFSPKKEWEAEQMTPARYEMIRMIVWRGRVM